VAPLILYWRKKELFGKTVSSVGRPGALIVSSLMGITAFAFYIFAETFPIVNGTFPAASLSLAYELVATFFIVGASIYALSRVWLQRSGVDPGRNTRRSLQSSRGHPLQDVLSGSRIH
jgi:hypothetical protein